MKFYVFCGAGVSPACSSSSYNIPVLGRIFRRTTDGPQGSAPLTFQIKQRAEASGRWCRAWLVRDCRLAVVAARL